MSETNVGANLVFARRTKTGIKPMFENEFETIAPDIGTQTIVVRRANTRFAPTLVLLIGLIPVFVRRANIRFDQQTNNKKFTTIYPKIYDRLLSSRANIRFAPTSGWHISKWGTYFFGGRQKPIATHFFHGQILMILILMH